MKCKCDELISLDGMDYMPLTKNSALFAIEPVIFFFSYDALVFSIDRDNKKLYVYNYYSSNTTSRDINNLGDNVGYASIAYSILRKCKEFFDEKNKYKSIPSFLANNQNKCFDFSNID